MASSLLSAQHGDNASYHAGQPRRDMQRHERQKERRIRR
jgi:hypothetical protein